MDINRYFDNYLDITKKDGKKIHIERKNVYINDFSQFDGFVNIIKKGSNVVILREIYSFDDKRLRYSYDEYINPKVFNTYEIGDNGVEIPITVIETYDEKINKIGSIGNILKINPDKLNNKEENKKPKILKLFKPRETNSMLDVA